MGADGAIDTLAPPVTSIITNGPQVFQVKGFTLKGSPLLTSNTFVNVLGRFAGPDRSLADLVEAAAALQHEYQRVGITNVSVMLFRRQITNDIVQFNVFRGATPYILVEGQRCSPAPAVAPSLASTDRGQSRAAATNAPLGFLVRAYEISGDTLLSEAALTKILEKYTGTNITAADIGKAGSELQLEYRQRGYPTVKVVIPPQQIDSNAIVKIRVFQGRLAEINVVGNRFFSSNDVIRALPSLHTNMILIGPVFQAELDRANASQDRQISGELGPGPTEGTTVLDLQVKDRLPLHAKSEFNNQNSPETPDLRLNSSIVYNNLWQLEHSIGFQYSFSPQEYKSHNQYSFLDEPLVANYGAFYRLPLGTPAPVANAILSQPASFGYSEATRQFRLPAPSGQAEFNMFASRSSIDTGLLTLSTRQIANVTNAISIIETDVQQDLTLNSDVGSRLTIPLALSPTFQSSLSGGVDYKTYQDTSNKTNIFTVITAELDSNGHIIGTNVSVVHNRVPTTQRALDYLPFTLRYTVNHRDAFGSTSLGLGLAVNAWYSGDRSMLQSITGSTESSGHWVTLTPSLSRDFLIHTNWVLSLNASGQWASEPLPSNEQFGVGGIGSVRGYHEGEEFGNDGWWMTAEQKTPPYIVGRVYGHSLLVVRSSVYMGYGQTFAVGSRQDLWGVGFGGAASLGANWEAKLLFSWPLIATIYTSAGQPRFDFALSAQF